MKGAWLTRAEIMSALKLTQGKFERGLERQLKWKFVGNRKKFFLTEDRMPDEVRQQYNRIHGV